MLFGANDFLIYLTFFIFSLLSLQIEIERRLSVFLSSLEHWLCLTTGRTEKTEERANAANNGLLGIAFLFSLAEEPSELNEQSC